VIEYVIPGKPVTWMRARRRGNMYFDIQVKDKQRMRRYVQESTIHPIDISIPVSVQIECHMPIPKSWSSKRKLNAVSKPHVSRPDLDNILKFIGDALNGVLWQDDCLIYRFVISKFYAEDPKTVIRIFTDEEIPIPSCAPIL